MSAATNQNSRQIVIELTGQAPQKVYGAVAKGTPLLDCAIGAMTLLRAMAEEAPNPGVKAAMNEAAKLVETAVA